MSSQSVSQSISHQTTANTSKHIIKSSNINRLPMCSKRDKPNPKTRDSKNTVARLTPGKRTESKIIKPNGTEVRDPLSTCSAMCFEIYYDFYSFFWSKAKRKIIAESIAKYAFFILYSKEQFTKSLMHNYTLEWDFILFGLNFTHTIVCFFFMEFIRIC